MSTHIAPGDMVEGQKTKIIARKIDYKKISLQKHEITEKYMVAYTMDRNCSVEVIEKIELSEEERANRKPYKIFGEVGDILKADGIHLSVLGRRNMFGENVKEGVSARHGATVLNCPYHAIAKIQVPLQVHLNVLGMTAKPNERKKIKK